MVFHQKADIVQRATQSQGSLSSGQPQCGGWQEGFMLHRIFKNPCLQRSRFNKINNFYGFIKDSLKWNHTPVAVKDTMLLSRFAEGQELSPPILLYCNFSIIMKITFTSWPPWGSMNGTLITTVLQNDNVKSTFLQLNLYITLNLGDRFLEIELLNKSFTHTFFKLLMQPVKMSSELVKVMM